MNTHPTTAWLLGDGPDPGEEARAAFTEAELPPGLADRTLEAVATLRATNATPMRPRLELHRGGRVRRLLFGSVAALAVAAGLLLILPTGQQPGDIDAMVPRGQGFDLPGLDLRMAVRQGDVVDRLRADRAYQHGDIFYFRYEAGAEGWIHLVHASDTGIEILDSREVAAGSADLTRGSETVSHYRASVGDWEIWNEPNAAFGAAEYGEILKLAAQSIRKADPRARIVGFSGGGFNTKFYDEVLRRAGADSFDVASVHFYGNQLETHRAYDSFLKRTGKPGWNTETGASCPTSFTTLPDFESLRFKDHWAHLQNEVRRVTENSVKNYLISLSVGGMERYFHYFARMGNCSPSQPTRWFGSGKEINEFDGSLRANGVGLCIASHFIDGSKYHGPVVLDDRLQVHLFKRTEGCVGYLYSVSDKLEIPQSKNMNLQFHDIMGNRLPGDRISIGSSPVYFTTELDAAESIRTLNSLSGDE